jgi:ISXO2-like transposase domain
MPAVHMAASQLKRWIDGTLHQGISREQLAYYLDEFTFRFNRRTARSRGLLFLPAPPAGHEHRPGRR